MFDFLKRRASGEEAQEAEAYILEHTALHRHYNTEGTQDVLLTNLGIDMPRRQVSEIVQKIRDSRGFERRKL